MVNEELLDEAARRRDWVFSLDVDFTRGARSAERDIRIVSSRP
jgi:hypothetical protein